MKPKLYFAAILSVGYFTFTPFLANGAPAGHLSVPHDRGNEVHRLIHPFWGFSYQFVGTACYVVASEPTVGEVDRFETASAEFVGQGTL
jgi:hypothetical protein